MELKNIEASKCFESPTNPRGNVFPTTEFAELVASIKEKGVLQPVLARPVKGGKFEIVAGNRRFRAAKEAGLAWVPAQIGEMTDMEVREAQIIENLQRSDISPFDEALAYEDLIKASARALDVEGIAAKVGKSPSYIRQRMALLNLKKEYAEKVRIGLLPVAHAQLIARLDQKEQAGAYDEAIDRWSGIIKPLAKLRIYVQDVIVRNAMQSPPWKDDEAAQAEIARVTGIKGGGKTLFGEKTAATFDDPAQYALALAAYINITVEKYKADGKKLALISTDHGMSGKGSRVLGRSRYSLCGGKPCKSAVDALVVEGKEIGSIKRICKDRKCLTHNSHLKYAGSSAKPEETEAQRQQREKADQKKADEKAKENADFIKAIARVKSPLSQKHIDLVFELILEQDGGQADDVGEIYGLEPVKEYGMDHYEASTKKHFSKDATSRAQYILAALISGQYNKTERAKLLKRL